MSCKPHTRPQFDFEIGRGIGHWTVLANRSSKTTKHAIYTLCRCSCGVVREVRADILRRGESQSCGHVRTPGRKIQWQIVIDRKKMPALKYVTPKQARKILIMEAMKRRKCLV